MPIRLSCDCRQMQGRHPRELGGAQSGWSTQGEESREREVGEVGGAGMWGALEARCGSSDGAGKPWKDLGHGSEGILFALWASSFGLQGSVCRFLHWPP